MFDAAAKIRALVEMFCLSIRPEQHKRLARSNREGRGLFLGSALAEAADGLPAWCAAAAQEAQDRLAFFAGAGRGEGVLVTPRALCWRLSGEAPPDSVALTALRDFRLGDDGVVVVNGIQVGEIPGAPEEDVALLNELLSFVTMQLPFRVGGDEPER